MREFDLKGCWTIPAKLTVRRKAREFGALIVGGRVGIRYGEHMKKERRLIMSQREFPRIRPGSSRQEVAKAQEEWLNSGITTEVDYYVGLYFDPKTWDGSDFFVDQKPSSMLLCTERVVEMVESAGLTGCEFLPLENYDWGVPNPFLPYMNKH
jgi:hypothetical protein